MDAAQFSIKGMYRDLLKGPDQRVIYDSGWTSNTIMPSCRILLTAFMKNEVSAGIRYLAVGEGDAQWDKTGAPAPDPGPPDLVHRCIDAPIPQNQLELRYLNDQELEVNDPTKRLQIKATLAAGYPAPLSNTTSYPLREFGLFGSLGADSKDCMINCVRHPVIYKDKDSTLVRVIRLYF